MAKQESRKQLTEEQVDDAAPLTLIDIAGEILFHIAGAAQDLRRIADHLAPQAPARASGSRGGTVLCHRGHGMQAGESECQTCWRLDHPRGPRAA